MGARYRSLHRARGACAATATRLIDRPPRECRPLRARRPGELVHVDIKKLGRILQPGHRVTGERPRRKRRARPAGSTCSSRSTTTRGSASPPSTPMRRQTRARVPGRARPLLRSPRHPVERVLTDNGACFKRRWADACARHGSRSKDTRPTAHRPTAKPSASSAPCSSAGPTPAPTSNNPALAALPQHSTSTTASVPTALSQASRRYVR